MNEKIVAVLDQINYPNMSKSLVEIQAVTRADFDESGNAVIALKPLMADNDLLAKLEAEIVTAVEAALSVKAHVLFGNVKKEETGENAGESVFKRKRIAQVGAIIPIISGKGGVGKSTISVNLALTLSSQGYKVGLLDLDIFGPSVHKMLNVANAKLTVEDGKILPCESKGLKVVSIGMALTESDALIIRGPMVMKLLDQLLNDVAWGDLDYLLVDMPPGTGDVPLSLAQQLQVTGAVVVTTPQEVALMDVRRAVKMLQTTEVNILGIVENMSEFICPNCNSATDIFGSGGALNESKSLGINLIGTVPIYRPLRVAGDSGESAFDPKSKESPIAKVFNDIANQVVTLAAIEEIKFAQKAKVAAQSATS
ncbi:MAG: P-loop NTPase [Nitrospinota bacterium]